VGHIGPPVSLGLDIPAERADNKCITSGPGGLKQLCSACQSRSAAALYLAHDAVIVVVVLVTSPT
jgi:hypothetical protein